MTNSQRMRDSAEMMSSTTPSAKYSCSGSPLRFRNGKHGNGGLVGKLQRVSGRLIRVGGPGPCGTEADRWLRFPDLADEPESLAGDGSDQALFLAAVADRLARGIDMAGEGRFGDDASAPHHVQQLILADDVLTVLHQIEQQVEDLRPDRNGLGAPRELPSFRVEHVVLEPVLHFGPPWSRPQASDP